MKLEKERKLKWAILTTGYGKNASDTINSFSNGTFEASKLELVIYENDPCIAAEVSKSLGIETVCLLRKDFNDPFEYQRQIIHLLKQSSVDYIFLLNFKYKIREELLSAFPDRILNIHPSLFPSFLGTKTAIQDALDYGVKITGITTHIIDDKLDEGIILHQKAIKIRKNDTFDTLYPRFVKHGLKIVQKTISSIENAHLYNNVHSSVSISSNG